MLPYRILVAAVIRERNLANPAWEADRAMEVATFFYWMRQTHYKDKMQVALDLW
jgi:hypothetical protein